MCLCNVIKTNDVLKILAKTPAGLSVLLSAHKSALYASSKYSWIHDEKIGLRGKPTYLN